jgi:1,4-dihydroxy-2-naphthoate octaprenyltransferase
MNVAKGLKLPLYFTSFSPVLVVWAYAGFRNTVMFVLLVAVVMLMQAALNLSMDFFDHNSGRVLRNEDTIFPIGSYLIERSGVKPGTVRIYFVISAILSISVGLFIVFFYHKYSDLIIGVLAVIVSLMYVLPPFRFNSRGFGELSTFLSFGIFTVSGSAIAFGVPVTLQFVLVALLLGFLASAIRYLHHLPEDRPDSVRVKKFSMIYALVLFPGLAIQAFFPREFLFLLIPIAVSIYHFATLKKDVIGISRMTNQIVLIQVLSAILLTVYFAIA